MKYILILILLLMSPFAFSLEECEPVTPPEDIPCQVVSTWNYTPPCNSYNATVFNSSGANVINYSFSDFGSTNLCVFDWNLTITDTYYYSVENGDTGQVVVKGDNVNFEIGGGFFLAFIYLLWVAFLFMLFTVRGRNGDYIGFFNIMQMLLAFAGGTMMLGHSFLIGFPTIFIGIGVFIGLIAYSNTSGSPA